MNSIGELITLDKYSEMMFKNIYLRGSFSTFNPLCSSSTPRSSHSLTHFSSFLPLLVILLCIQYSTSTHHQQPTLVSEPSQKHLQHNLKLTLTAKNHYLTLFTKNILNVEQVKIQEQTSGQGSGQEDNKNKEINFLLDFSASDIVVDKEYYELLMQGSTKEGVAKTDLYLDREHKKRLISKKQLNQFVKVQSIRAKTDSEDLTQGEKYHGIIGMKFPGSLFVKKLKDVLNLSQLKLWFKIYENAVELVSEPCRVPIFPPYKVEIETPYSTRYYQNIEQPTLGEFVPSTSGFLNMMKKTSNPFLVSNDELHQKLNLQFFNEIQSVPLKSLLVDKCLKVADSSNYQCDIRPSQEQKHSNNNNKQTAVTHPGILLFEFDPLLCTDRNAIQLRQEGNVDSEGYYLAHIFLIVGQFGLLVLFINRGKFQKHIGFLLASYRNRGYQRSH